MKFISILPDNFRGLLKILDTVRAKETAVEQANVRRPLRGLVQGEDYYSVLKVVKSDGTSIPITNSSVSNNSAGYTSNYIIQAVNEQRAEKSQIVETFGENFIYFFGERPRTMSFSGCLLNSNDFNWKTEFWQNYETYFRGTKLIELDARIYLSFGDVMIEGYMIGANAAISAEDEHRIQFAFEMILTNYHYLRPVTTKFTHGLLTEIPANTYDGLASYNKYADQGVDTQGSLSKIMGVISSGINSVTSGVNSMISAFKQIAFGRQIRVPMGAGGSEAMTSDFQVAQRGGIGIQAGKVIRKNLLKGNRIDLSPIIGSSIVNNLSRMGLHTYDNYDEYPNGGANASLEKEGQNAIRAESVTHVPDADADKAVRRFMIESGMDILSVEGLTDLQLTAGKLAFGVLNFTTSLRFESGTGPSVTKHERYDNDGPSVSERFVRQDHSRDRAIEPVIIPNPARRS